MNNHISHTTNCTPRNMAILLLELFIQLHAIFCNLDYTKHDGVYYNQESVMNADDIIAYIEEKGLYIYTLKMTLAEGTKINIKMGVDTIITADHLTNVNAQEVCVTKEGD